MRTWVGALFAWAALGSACGGRSGIDVLGGGSEVARDAGARDASTRDAGTRDGGSPGQVDAAHDARPDVPAPPARDGGLHLDATQARPDASHDSATQPDVVNPVDAPEESSLPCVTGCVPRTCADAPLANPLGGPAPDGCGDEIECGGCECVYPGLPASCNGAVTVPPNVWLDIACCGVASCLPETCEDLGIACGRAPDGCGDVLQCGACKEDGSCPSGGKPGACTPCVPKTCASLGFECGTVSDGCGATLECGGCDPCVPCFGGMCAGVFVSDCVPETCASLGIECGLAGDGCGAALECGTCAAPFTCARGVCVSPCM